MKRTPFPKARPREPHTRPTPIDAPRESSAPAAFSVLDRVRSFEHAISVAELAPILGVSEDVLYRMVRDGKIPQLVLPGRKVTRFDPATIVFWLLKNNPILNQVQRAS